MRRRRALRLLAACAASAMFSGWLLVGPAGALAPDRQGWWTSANSSELPTSPPAPPDVPANGLLVEGGPSTSSPTAYAALVYQLPEGATASSLTLSIAPSSATTPNSTLELCPLEHPFISNPEQGGPSSEAPAYNCTHNVTASANAAGSAYKFDASSLMSNGTLAVAILPTKTTDRVVFSHPDSNSLAVQVPASQPTAFPQSQASTPSLGVALPQSQATKPSSGLPFIGALTPVAPPVSPPAATAGATPTQPATSTGNKRFEAIPSLGISTSNASPTAVALVLAGVLGGGALWFMVGRERGEEQPTMLTG